MLDLSNLELKISDNNCIFTIVNKGYIDIGSNFLKRIEQLNMFYKMIFVCTDLESYLHFKSNSFIQAILQEKNLPTQNFVSWKDKEYFNLVFNKFDITKFILDYALNLQLDNVLYLDTDIWCFQNFEKKLFDLKKDEYFYADLLMQDGENYRLNPDPIKQNYINGNFIKDRSSKRHCTGFMMIKPSPFTNSLFDYKNNNKVDYTKFVGNQPFLNKVIESEPNLIVANLDRDLGLNGSLFNDEGAVEKLNLQDSIKIIDSKKDTSWFLHYTYCKGKDKISKMKEFNHWIK